MTYADATLLRRNTIVPAANSTSVNATSPHSETVGIPA
jgi:hypothetical protein